MKLLTATSALCLGLFSSAFVAGKSTPAQPEWADSLRPVYLYTEGIKQQSISGDTIRAMEFFREAIRSDSTYAPAYYELAMGELSTAPDRALALARKAHRLDTANVWYHQLYGQTLLVNQRYDEALGVFRRLRAEDADNPDVYRILAALYEQAEQPFSAIATLDSAEVRFGAIPMLGTMKRRLLVSTHQTDRAIDEARALVDAAPYEAEHHVTLAELYGIAGRDSLALAEYDRALEIDSTSVQTLIALSDFYNQREDYSSLLGITRRLFETEAMPLDGKIRLFKLFTSDTRLYRNFYPRINDLASTLAIRYPGDKRVVELYTGHLIASGELEQALAFYKLHLDDKPPQEDFYRTVIDIESYLQRPDSVKIYIDRALALFPGKPEFQIAKGNALFYAKQYDNAIRAYEQSLRYAATDSLRGAIWGMIGDTWHQKALLEGDIAVDHYAGIPARKGSGKAMKATYKAYDRSLRYYPDNPLTMNNYAYFLAEEGRDLEKALAMSSRVIALTDNNPTYLDTHAWVLFRMGRAAEAKKIMQQAIALDSRSSAELLLHYGDILDALGERFMAETYWRKALEKGSDAEAVERRLKSGKKE